MSRGNIMQNSKSAIGLRIKELRESIGLTQTELAQKSKLARTVIPMIENGQRYPSEKTLSKIVEALGVSMDDIYTDEVREQAIKNLQECSNNFTKNATTDEIIKVYRKMIKNDK